MLNKSQFDRSFEPIWFDLTTVVRGFREGLGVFKSGEFTVDQNNIATFSNYGQGIIFMPSGLGYYNRAKNLHETAKIISNKYDGFFPTDKNSLIALPGIGEYTSSAIMAIAFDRKSNVIDGNVERVFSRFYAVEKPIEESKIFIKNIAEKHLPDQRHGDYAQALMDLGSLICIPKSPRCTMCPLLAICDVGGSTRAKQYPIKLPKKEKEERYGLFFYLQNKDGAVLFETCLLYTSPSPRDS